jgi:two-component system, cell cycle sensor histidine kinase and response regulator CckA
MPSDLLSPPLSTSVQPTSVSVYRLLAAIPGAVYRCELANGWRVLEVSEGVRALCGRPPSDFLDGRLSWSELVHAEDRPDVERLLADTLESAAPFVAEYRILHADGRLRWIHDTAVVVNDASGRPGFLDGVAVDVTDRRRVEDDLRESENRYRTAFVTSPDAILVVREADGVVLEVNDGFTRMVGYRSDEVVGRRSCDLGLWSDSDLQERFLAAVRRDDFCSNLEARFRLKDGSVKIGLISAHFIDRHGERCIVSITRDISARHEAEEQRRTFDRQMQQAQKLESLGVLAGGVAHDFNNILMAILGFAELALEALPPGSPAAADIGDVTDAAHRAADLCRQLLAYSGKASFAVEPVDLGRLIEGMLDLLRSSISKKARLHVRVEPGLPSVAADSAQLRQVVMNLVVNASEALGDDEGDLSLSLSLADYSAEQLRALDLGSDLAAGRYVRIEVTDTGCGMTPDTRARMFEPFYTTKFSGRGLGLPAVLGIVRAHRGGLEVGSNPPRGTRFAVLLPTVGGTLSDPGSRSAENEWRGHGTVLFVDDEESLRTIGGRMLVRLGFSVVTARDGREAVDVYREHGSGIALVILDLTMPHLDGVQAFEQLRRLDPNVRVVLASGYSEEDVAGRFPGRSLAGVLQKPYTLDRLKALLRRIMS